MIRQPRSTYVHARSTTLYKVKRWIDEDAVVEGYEEAEGGMKGLVGVLLCRTPGGMLLRVGTGFKAKDRKAPPPIGATITYHYTHKTKSGKPRTPAFLRVRTDV